MSYLAIVTEPTEYPISVSAAKNHLRVDADVTDEDIGIEDYIAAATRHCEGIARRSFVNQTLDLTMDAWPADVFTVKRPPLVSVTSISYVDEDGNSDTVSSDDYIVDTAGGRIALKASASWPSVTLRRIAGVTIRYVAGYGAADDVPADFRHAVQLVVGDWFENRENMIVGTISSPVEFNVMRLLQVRRSFPIVE